MIQKRAPVMLVLVTVLWGVSFPLMKGWQEAAITCPGGEELSSVTLIALRMLLALIILGITRPRLVMEPTRREHLAGLAIGAAFALGFIFQVWGLAQTTPARSAFITSLSSAWVPVMAFVCFRTPVAGVTLLGLAVGILGTGILSVDNVEEWTLGPGEARTLIASLFFAGQVLLLDRLGRGVRSSHVTIAFLGITVVLAGLLAILQAMRGSGLIPWLGWIHAMLSQPAVLRDFLLVTFLPTVLAFHWMNTWQPHVSATRAAMIYLLEPVFASLFSLILGYENISTRLLIGGSLIIGGNLLVEVPAFLALRRLRS